MFGYATNETEHYMPLALDLAHNLLIELANAIVMRFEAAKAAAPYIHPRLAAVEHSGPDGGALLPPVIQFVRDEDPAE